MDVVTTRLHPIHFLAAACALTASVAQGSQEVTDVSVRVDPRVELVSIVFRLLGAPEYAMEVAASPYAESVDAHFGALRDHRAVTLASELRANIGISHDAAMSFAVHLTDDFAPRTPFEDEPGRLEPRWTPEAAVEFGAALRDFARASDFGAFFEAHAGTYRVAEERVAARLAGRPLRRWFDTFFGVEAGAAFTVVPGLLLGGQAYGVAFEGGDGRLDLFATMGIWEWDDEGLPAPSEVFVGYAVHEFGHSYVNPLVDRHLGRFAAVGRRIFPLVEDVMSQQAYNEWRAVLYESVVRAAVIRYLRDEDGPPAARRQIGVDRRQGFSWVRDLARLMERFEEDRDRYPTLEDFMPAVLEFFEELAGEMEELEAKRPRLVAITPSNGAQDVDPRTQEIVLEFDRSMVSAWSILGAGDDSPELVGGPVYEAENKRLRIGVRLRPDTVYRFGLNGPQNTGFRSLEGVPLRPVIVTFRTAAE